MKIFGIKRNCFANKSQVASEVLSMDSTASLEAGATRTLGLTKFAFLAGKLTETESPQQRPLSRKESAADPTCPSGAEERDV